MRSLERLLIVRVGAMGDVLHALPAVTALRRAMPHLHISWAIEPRWLPLLACTQRDDAARGPAMPVVDTVHAVPTRAWSAAPFSRATARSVLALRRELVDAHYDLAIDLQGSVRSAVIARLSGAARVAGSSAPREAPARLLYTQRIATPAAHVVAQAAQIVSAATGVEISPAETLLPFCPDADAWADDLYGGEPLRNSNGVVVLAPTAGWGAKQWPAAHFADLARALDQRGYAVLLNAASPDDAVAAAILAQAPGCARLLCCTIAQLMSVLRRARLLVAGDTGPLHLAAAVGCATVGLFGPTDPARTGAWTTTSHAASPVPSRTLRHAQSRTSHARTPATEAGLARISTADVLAAALDLLG